MRRKPISRWLRMGVATALWASAVVAVQAGAERDIGKGTRQLEERIELQLRLMERGPVAPLPPQAPERSHEDSLEPWELVGV